MRDFSKFTVSGVRDALKTTNNQNNTSGGDWYRFWDMPVGSRVVIRFLPDKNEENSNGFFIDKLTHKLIINGEEKTIPCLKQHNKNADCPVCKVSAQFYANDKARGITKSVEGKKYWRTMQHICQALVIEDPLPPNAETGETAVGKVKLFSFGWQVWSLIMEGYDSGDLEVIPFAYQGGTDFIIKKSQKGEHADYSIGTKFANKPRDLSEEEIAYVESKLIDLTTVLPQLPTVEKVDSMLQAALTGEMYEGDSDSEHNDDIPDETSKPASKPSLPKQEAKQEPAAAAESNSNDADEEDDVLARIRRKKQQAQASA